MIVYRFPLPYQSFGCIVPVRDPVARLHQGNCLELN